MDLRKLLFILIGIICAISIIFALYSQFYYKAPAPKNETISQTNTNEIDEQDLIDNFSTIFSNTIDYQKNNTSNINKKDFNKGLVYTSYEINEQQPNKYNINAKIPAINISGNTALLINNDIENNFKDAISNIIASSKGSDNQLYDVEYMAYVNSNILSLVVKATLKVGDSAQRVLVKTYNYNLTTNEELKFADALSLKGVSQSFAKKKIKETVTKANNTAQALKDLGHPAYLRDLDSNIYNIENTSIYFIGQNAVLYVIYPYGNNNMTSAMDIIIF